MLSKGDTLEVMGGRLFIVIPPDSASPLCSGRNDKGGTDSQSDFFCVPCDLSR